MDVLKTLRKLRPSLTFSEAGRDEVKYFLSQYIQLAYISLT